MNNSDKKAMSHTQEIQGKLKKGYEFKKRTNTLVVDTSG